MSNPLDIVIFDGKTSSDVFKEIYNNSKKKDKQINSLIAELKPLIQNIGDAPVVVPLINEYLEVSVKNDEHLVKMAAVVQRAMTRTDSSTGEFSLTEDEKQQLIDTMNDMEEANLSKMKEVKNKVSK